MGQGLEPAATRSHWKLRWMYLFLLPLSFFLFVYLTTSREFHSEQWRAEVTQFYNENIGEWQKVVANTTSVSGRPRFIILKQVSSGEIGDASYIVYDESDEIANPHGLHLQFWIKRLSHASPTMIQMDFLQSIMFDEHYYWIIEKGVSRTYALQKIGDEIRVIQWNCSSFISPLTQACPEQILDGLGQRPKERMSLPRDRNGYQIITQEE